jgi:large subunit ribosomal protein L10
MSKPVKEMIAKVYKDRFEGVESLALVNLTGVDANRNTALRARLREKDIQVTVVKNSLAKKAFRDLGLDTAAEALDGPCAVAYGADSVVTVVRELLEIRKETKSLGVKAAVMEGNLFDESRIEELSKYPTRDEAIADVVGAVLSSGANVAGALMGPAGGLAGCLKAIEDKHNDAEE